MSDWLEAVVAAQRPRAIAALTRYFRNIDIAEEAFADACLKALTAWEHKGSPNDPLAWLLTAARNAGVDSLRKSRRRSMILAQNCEDLSGVQYDVPDVDELRDDVLRLLFICCHPELERQDQIAIALRIVLGLSVHEIARAFLIKPKTMEQRITRAKKKIASNPVTFETQGLQEQATRLGEVSLMIYLMFNEGWSASTGPDQIRPLLCDEAIRLARLLVTLFPEMGEQVALLALLLFLHSRRQARIDADGHLVVLEHQDRSLWDRYNIAEATSLLQRACRISYRGAFVIQATIAAAHAGAKSNDDTDWVLIAAHYAALYRIQPTPIVRLNQIGALDRIKGSKYALDAMKELSKELSQYRWFHTMRGALLQDQNDHKNAISAFETALELTPTDPEVTEIMKKIQISKKALNEL